MKLNRFKPQSGFVAIFSVIFFALLALVITIGFIRIVNLEQQQALNNDLTARALAAAEAGIEDAKRAIYHYSQLPPNSDEREQFRQALSSSECNALFRSDSIVAQAIGLNPNGQVAGDQNLFYTCLTVSLDTSNYIKTLTKDENHVVALRAKGNYDRVTIEWHLNSEEIGKNGDGIPDRYHPVGDFPAVTNFGRGANQPPAYIRAQLIGAPNGNFTRTDLQNTSRTIFLSPSTGGGNQVNIETGDPRGFNHQKVSPYQANCQSANEARNNVGGYACRMTLLMPDGNLSPANNAYFLQITPIYRDTRISVRLSDGDQARLFDGAQPKIDSTGRAADVFRRVEARVAFPEVPYSQPRFGIEVGDNICKQFQVTDVPGGYYNPSPASSKCFDPFPPPVCSGSNDIVLVLDRSTSMKEQWEGTNTIKFDKLKEVASKFVRNTGVEEAGNHISIVSFSKEGTLDVELTGDQNPLISSIEGLTTSDNTNYEGALNAARPEFASPRNRPDNPDVLIFISDGAPSYGGGRDVILPIATQIKDSGVVVYTIAIKNSGGREYYDPTILQEMAGNGGEYIDASSAAALDEGLEKLSATLRC